MNISFLVWMNKNTGVVVNGNWNQINTLLIKYLSLSPFWGPYKMLFVNIIPSF